MLKKLSIKNIFIVAVAVFGFAFFQIIDLVTNNWWFKNLNFESVYWTSIESEITLFIVAFIVSWVLLSANLLFSFRNCVKYGNIGILTAMNVPIKLVKLIGLGANLLVAWLIAQVVSNNWESVLQFFHSTNFGSKDPIFHNDISFYVFRLPTIQGVISFFLTIGVLATITTSAFYLVFKMVDPEKGIKGFLNKVAKMHYSIIFASLAIVIGVKFGYSKFDILYSSTGVVFGAGYTDVHAVLNSYLILQILSFLIAAVLLYALVVKKNGGKILLYTIGVFIAALVILKGFYPWFQQEFQVKPNELEKETPFIKHNIKMTREAYNLHKVKANPYKLGNKLSRKDIHQNQTTIENIRLWDNRPLEATYRQLQEMRLYYRFNDVDIDRYIIDGKYRQVMMSARELAYHKVPAKAQRWENKRLKYTHGYGLTMSPVNEVTKEGLPRLFIKDIPPVSEIDLQVTQPAIYYGEETNHYIFTGANTQEFDYAVGKENKYTTYKGNGGISIASTWRKIVYALQFKSIKILISKYFTNNTKIHYDRNIITRVKKIAPFLELDRDPYITLHEGRIMWVLDAYTVSDKFPYSLSSYVYGWGKRVNYMRNPVKVVIDAFNGDVSFYVVDKKDPIIQTYMKIFPKLFKSKDKIPQGLERRFRYPVDYFSIQAEIFKTYHMNDVRVFYNKEDMWDIPNEIYEGSSQPVEPYYVTMKLPQTKKEEFLLIMPFTPVRKDNMISWMAARSDGEHYGKLLLYEFPKNALVYGPKQIEARIDQNPVISQQLTLWSTGGSKVIRGNLLTIPINGALLYVEPLYIRADSGQIPELKRVIVALGQETIVMEETLDKAIETLFGSNKMYKSLSKNKKTNLKDLANSALKLFVQGQKNLKNGNWAKYGQMQKELKSTLKQLKRSSR